MPEKELKTKEAKELFEAIAKLRSAEESQKFFRDLCTIKELSDMIERFQVAKCISQKETYRNIAKKTGSSTATITRVAHWFNHGMGGYLLALERMKQK